MNTININAPKGDKGIQGKQGIQGVQGEKRVSEFTGRFKRLIHFSDRIKEQLIFMMFFAMLFAGFGYYIPKIYYTYFDKTQYYEVKLPIEVENKKYYPCDYVNVHVIRRSLINVTSEAQIELRLYRDDGSGIKDLVDKQFRKLNIIKSSNDKFDTIISHWLIPCFVQPGRYIFEGLAPYKVNGIDKTTLLITEDFIINASSSAIKK